MEKSLFVLDSYVKSIKWKMSQKKEKWGLLSSMAEAADCQKSHMSRVLTGKVDLSLEQAQGLCVFFNFNEVEADYFMTQVEYARAGTKVLRAYFEKRLKKIRNEQEDLSKRLNKPSIGTEEKEIIYYSAWHWSAIHILVSIPEFQNVKAISQRLSLAESFVKHGLETLESYGLVRREGEKWLHLSGTVHLPKKSPLITSHHSNWRARAASSSQNPKEDGLHFTIVQSLSKNDFEKVKQILLNTIDDYNKVASPSKEEDLACFCLDWFKV